MLLNVNTPFIDAKPKMVGGWNSIVGKASVCFSGHNYDH